MSDDSRYAKAEVDNAHVVARESALEFVLEAISSAGTLYDYAASRPDAEVLQGRQLIYTIPGPASGRWVVRHLSHGGRLAPLTQDRFLKVGIPRPFNELKLAVKLRQARIPTPAVVAAVVYRSGLTYRGDVAREEITDASDLRECLFGSELPGSLRTAYLAATGRLIGALHRAGVNHPDLNIRNVLIRWRDKEPEAYILDVERCTIKPQLSRRARRRMLHRFQRSARKFERRSGEHVGQDEWEAFFSAYVMGLKGLSWMRPKRGTV